MEFLLEHDKLTIKLKGEINSQNANDLEDEIGEIIGKNKFKYLELDFKDIVYVSSAGLRIILKLRRDYDDLTIINVNQEVYDVFNMTGFTNLIDIKLI